ncbi:hypothetical protein ACIQVA_33740 [Streptomyces microflavus]|uniref:hypothetical protein n=1 Tax=Streptomyces microflavus TaxID=1919 RepID=UPI0037F5D8B1
MPDSHPGPEGLDRFLAPAPVLQTAVHQPVAVYGGEHLQYVDLAAPLAQQPRPRKRAEPLPPSGLQFHNVQVAAFEQPRNQLGRDTAGPRPDPEVKISSVHGHAP